MLILPDENSLSYSQYENKIKNIASYNFSNNDN